MRIVHTHLSAAGRYELRLGPEDEDRPVGSVYWQTDGLDPGYVLVIHGDGEPYLPSDAADVERILASAGYELTTAGRSAIAAIAPSQVHAAAQPAAGGSEGTGELLARFKHENEVGGEPFGPLVVIDVAAAHADPNTSDGLGVPYGRQAPWRQDKGWMRLSEAKAIADSLGVPLDET